MVFGSRDAKIELKKLTRSQRKNAHLIDKTEAGYMVKRTGKTFGSYEDASRSSIIQEWIKSPSKSNLFKLESVVKK
jgi:hypothetical protein